MFQLYLLHLWRLWVYMCSTISISRAWEWNNTDINLQLYIEDITIKFVFEMVDSLCYCYFSSILTTSIQMIFPFYLEFSYSYTTNLLLYYLLWLNLFFHCVIYNTNTNGVIIIFWMGIISLNYVLTRKA